MSDSNLAAIVLPAGPGTRMRSKHAKVLHELGRVPMIARSLRPLTAIGANPIVVVVGYQAAEVEAAARANSNAHLMFALQPELRGTGDSARCGLGALPREFAGDVMIAHGDMPMAKPETLAALHRSHRETGAPLSFISVRLDGPSAFGRVVRDAAGKVRAIVEARDATEAEKQINEFNTGFYCADANFLRSALEELNPNNAQGEYYLTDVVAIAYRRGLEVNAWRGNDPVEFSGINSREELANMEAQIREQTNRKLMAAGVTLIDPATAYISDQAEISSDVVIGPNVQILGKCRIAEGVHIDGTAWLKDVEVGARCHLKIGIRAEECRIGEDSEIGPFAHLRAGTELQGHNRIGNFVETKKARIGRGSKASHLSYLGDATIGEDTNVGCGVITVNYDGYEKHHTQIGDRCMIGCDTQLIAPVTVGSDVYVASGTTIIREVADGALVMSHHPQREKPGWMETWRKRHNDPTPVKGAKK